MSEDIVAYLSSIDEALSEGKMATLELGRFAEAAAEIQALRASEAELAAALEGLIDDEPCRYDHHGYCQSHFITDPCEMATAREALAKRRKPNE